MGHSFDPNIEVKFKKLDLAAQTPIYGSAEAAGADLTAVGAHEIRPGERAIIPTGIAVELPAGTEGQVRPRSGLAAKNGITVLNTPGTIDSDYRGEIKVILLNTSDDTFWIKSGDRIAQLVIAPVLRARFGQVGTLGDSDRGTNGFGSTGVAS